MNIGKTLNLSVSVRVMDNAINKNYELIRRNIWMGVWELVKSSTLTPVYNSVSNLNN